MDNRSPERNRPSEYRRLVAVGGGWLNVDRRTNQRPFVPNRVEPAMEETPDPEFRQPGRRKELWLANGA